MASPKRRRLAKLAILKAKEAAVRAKEIANNIATVARKVAAEKAVKPLKEVLRAAEAKAEEVKLEKEESITSSAPVLEEPPRLAEDIMNASEGALDRKAKRASRRAAAAARSLSDKEE